jgi:putative ABC transport system permease protein
MWYFILKNLKGRKTFNGIIVAAVAVSVTMVLYTQFMTSGIRKEIEYNSRLLGPDMAVVPAGTKSSGHIYLTKGPPEQGGLPAAIKKEIARFPEVASMTCQRLLGKIVVDGLQVMRIGFEPETDFVVQPWLEKSKPGEMPSDADALALGFRVAPNKSPGDLLEVDGQTYKVAGRLREAASFLDTSVFAPLPGPAAGHQPENFSWVLLRLKRGTSLDMAGNRLTANISGVEIISRPEILKTINDQLHGILQGQGLGMTTLLIVTGAMLATGAIFALMMHERRREFGLLKAMGARNSFVFKLIIGEAFILLGIGAFLGAVFSALGLLLTDTGITVGIILTIPVMRGALLTLALTVAVGLVTALYPALLATRQEPYAAIRSGE